MSRRCSSPRRHAGFSLLEALIAIGVIGLAGSAILLATDASSRASNNALEQLIAKGLANQIVDEILGLPYKEKGQAAEFWPLGKESGESNLRIWFDDSDDFNAYASQPPSDAWGIELGQGDGKGSRRASGFQIAGDFFDDWEVRVTVSYVDESDLSSNLESPNTSGVRAVEVAVYRVEVPPQNDAEQQEENGEQSTLLTEITRVRRVCSYVPPFGV